jgi:phospholipid/cholesterol/gamma-HCH transport system ATP-binding protein
MQTQEAISTVDNPSTEPVISVNELQKSFGNHEVLKSISFSVSKGETLVVLGKSGSGKSILVKCLIGLVKPDAGNINIFGEDISLFNQQQMNDLRLRMGFLFQSGALYDSMTVRENLAFPLNRTGKKTTKQTMAQTIEKQLDDVGLLDAMYKMPSELSGGMRKRIALARSLILQPEVMLYDEPTTGLDTITSKEISELILRMQKKLQTTSIIITHDMACAQLTADRIIVVHEGHVVETGSYESLASSNNENVRSFF